MKGRFRGGYLERAVFESGDPLTRALVVDHGERGLVGAHRHHLDGAVLAARGQVGVAVVEDEGGHLGLQSEALVDLLPAQVEHVDGVVAADEQILLRSPGELQDGGAGDAVEWYLLRGVLLLLDVRQHRLVPPLDGAGHTAVVNTPTVGAVPAV